MKSDVKVVVNDKKNTQSKLTNSKLTITHTPTTMTAITSTNSKEVRMKQKKERDERMSSRINTATVSNTTATATAINEEASTPKQEMSMMRPNSITPAPCHDNHISGRNKDNELPLVTTPTQDEAYNNINDNATIATRTRSGHGAVVSAVAFGNKNSRSSSGSLLARKRKFQSTLHDINVTSSNNNTSNVDDADINNNDQRTNNATHDKGILSTDCSGVPVLDVRTPEQPGPHSKTQQKLLLYQVDNNNNNNNNNNVSEKSDDKHDGTCNIAANENVGVLGT